MVKELAIQNWQFYYFKGRKNCDSQFVNPSDCPAPSLNRGGFPPNAGSLSSLLLRRLSVEWVNLTRSGSLFICRFGGRAGDGAGEQGGSLFYYEVRALDWVTLALVTDPLHWRVMRKRHFWTGNGLKLKCPQLRMASSPPLVNSEGGRVRREEWPRPCSVDVFARDPTTFFILNLFFSQESNYVCAEKTNKSDLDKEIAEWHCYAYRTLRFCEMFSWRLLLQYTTWLGWMAAVVLPSSQMDLARKHVTRKRHKTLWAIDSVTVQSSGIDPLG